VDEDYEVIIINSPGDLFSRQMEIAKQSSL